MESWSVAMTSWMAALKVQSFLVANLENYDGASTGQPVMPGEGRHCRPQAHMGVVVNEMN